MDNKELAIGDVIYLNSDLYRAIPMTVVGITQSSEEDNIVDAVFWHGLQLSELSLSAVCVRK